MRCTPCSNVNVSRLEPIRFCGNGIIVYIYLLKLRHIFLDNVRKKFITKNIHERERIFPYEILRPRFYYNMCMYCLKKIAILFLIISYHNCIFLHILFCTFLYLKRCFSLNFKEQFLNKLNE